MITVISPEEAKKIMDSADPSSFILLDVRDENEFAEGHIAGARLIPVSTLDTRAAEELPDSARTLLVYCRSGMRAGKASQLLEQMGYQDIRNFGGVLTWPYGLVKD